MLVLQYDRHIIQVSRGIEESWRRAPNQFWRPGRTFRRRCRLSQLCMMGRRLPGEGLPEHLEVRLYLQQWISLKCLPPKMSGDIEEMPTTGMDATNI